MRAVPPAARRAGTRTREHPPRHRCLLDARNERRFRRRARAPRGAYRRRRKTPRESTPRADERREGPRPFVDGYLPELDEHSEERLRMEKSGFAIPGEVEPIDDLHTGAFEGLECGVKVLDVDRQVVHSGTSACEEARKKASGARGFHQLETIVAEAHGHQTEGFIVAQVRLDLDDRFEVPLEESHRRLELPKREREMIYLPAEPVLADRAAPIRRGEHGRIVLLPELDERAERRAGVDERGLVAVAFVETVDNANAVAFEPLEVTREPSDLERQMMKAF